MARVPWRIDAMVRDVSNAVERVQQPGDRAAASHSFQSEWITHCRQEGGRQCSGGSAPVSGFVEFTALSGFESGHQPSARDVVACSPKDTEKCPPFKPDYQGKSESAKRWHRDAAQRAKEAVELGPDKKYEVKKGDSLSGIAVRAIRGDKGKADAREIARYVKRLIEANKDAYPHLRCNPDLIYPGMRLKLPQEAPKNGQDTNGKPPGDSSVKPPLSGSKRDSVPHPVHPSGEKPGAREDVPHPVHPSGENPSAHFDSTSPPQSTSRRDSATPPANHPADKPDVHIDTHVPGDGQEMHQDTPYPSNGPEIYQDTHYARSGPEIYQDIHTPGDAPEESESVNAGDQSTSPRQDTGDDTGTKPGQDTGDDTGSRRKPDAGDTTTPDRSNFDAMRPRMRDLIGKPPGVLDPKTPPRLACAVAVSEVVNSADARIRKTVNSNQLERDMIAAGYERVTLDQARPGDVIIGKRPYNMAGHAAIYMGDGMIFNNNSDAGKMQIDSVDKFRKGMHDKQGRWNPNGYSEVAVYRRKNTTNSTAAA